MLHVGTATTMLLLVAAATGAVLLLLLLLLSDCSVGAVGGSRASQLETFGADRI